MHHRTYLFEKAKLEFPTSSKMSYLCKISPNPIIQYIYKSNAIFLKKTRKIIDVFCMFSSYCALRTRTPQDRPTFSSSSTLVHFYINLLFSSVRQLQYRDARPANARVLTCKSSSFWTEVEIIVGWGICIPTCFKK